MLKCHSRTTLKWNKDCVQLLKYRVFKIRSILYFAVNVLDITALLGVTNRMECETSNFKVYLSILTIARNLTRSWPNYSETFNALNNTLLHLYQLHATKHNSTTWKCQGLLQQHIAQWFSLSWFKIDKWDREMI